MQITIIRVGMYRQKSSDAMKPLIFPILAQLSPPGTELSFLDDRVENVPDKLEADIIVLSVETFAAKRAYLLAKQLKHRGNTIVMGGYHPTALPEEALRFCDVVLVGDAEDTFPQFLRDYRQGRVNRIYRSSGKVPMEPVDSGHPAFSGKKYVPLGVAQFSRGCKFRCDFCSVKTMYSGTVRQKSMEDFVWELKNAREKFFFFLDDNIFLDEQSAIRLFEAIRPLKKRWACQISMDVAFNDRLLQAMRRSGCVLVLIGFESLDSENLRQMNKAANLRAGDYDRAIENIYRHRLMIYATFVLGYDKDTPETIRNTLAFAQRHSFALANFNPLIPMPGTPLYRRLEEENRLVYRCWWLDNRYCYGDTAFYPRGMTPEELKESCREVRFRYYSMGCILKRLFKNRLHHSPGRLALYLAANLISAREIHKKQGRRLGGYLDEADTD